MVWVSNLVLLSWWSDILLAQVVLLVKVVQMFGLALFIHVIL